jgi:hypothetical protein
MPAPNGAALLAELVVRLEAVKPPRVCGDWTDIVRHDAWHQRLAAARVKQQPAEAAA